MRMDALNQLVNEQEQEKMNRRDRDSMTNWSEAFSNISDQARTPLTTASHIMSGSRPDQPAAQKNIMGPMMQKMNADSAKDILDRYRATDARGQVLQDYEAAKQKAKYDNAKLAIEQQKANRPPASDKSFHLSQEDREYWKSRGLSDNQLDLVARGYGGRNPANTLNSMAERDELSNQQINVIRDANEAELVINKMVEGLGNNSDWVGPIDGRIPNSWLGYTERGAEQVGWRTTVGRFNDLYRKAITGMGATLGEIEKLETRLPQQKDTYANFKAKAKTMLAELREKRAKYIESLEKGGQFVDNFKEDAPIPSPPRGSQPSGTAYANEKPSDEYDNLSDDELEKLLKEKGL
jgi:hypothetical protein